ncbi:MutS protein-like 4 [Armadillidium vulgare]|nr:MutS protein-like 4 [Armadillidium vulgare]
MALEAVEDPFFVTVKEAICVEGIDILKEILRLVLHEDARLLKGSTAMKAQRCYAIKAKVECLGKHYDLPTRVGHNSSKGFHIIIPLPKNTTKPKLPPCFIQTQFGRGCITCTTEEIYQLDQRSREKQREILSFSNIIVLELIAEIRERVGLLHGVAEAVAVLDMSKL